MTDAVFFIHGGPGFNSFPEKETLGPLLSARGISAYFWNEPSSLRDQGSGSNVAPTFPRWLAALEKEFLKFTVQFPKVRLVGFSFGSHGAFWLARKYPARIAQLTLIAPALDLYEALKSICRLSIADFECDKPERSNQIKRLIGQSKAASDELMAEALRLSLENERLLVHYWQNPERMQEWLKCNAAPEAQLDLSSFFGVLRTFEPSHLIRSGQPSDGCPVQLLYGELDPIIRNREGEGDAARGLYKNVREKVFARAGHFLHLEFPSEFIGELIGAACDE